MITSLQNPVIKAVRALSKRRERDRTGLTVVEGLRELTALLDAIRSETPHSWRIEILLVCPEYATDPETERILQNTQALGVLPLEVAPHIFNKLVYREDIGGILAVVHVEAFTLESLPVDADPFILVIEGVEKPGNLGAMLRSADGAGVDAVIVCDPLTDVFNPNVIRASLGSVFTRPVAVTDSETLHHWLKQKKIKTFASVPDADTNYTNADFRGSIAILMGSEADGLGMLWRERADETVRVPMMGKMDSLNASAATAVILYEAVRQRA